MNNAEIIKALETTLWKVTFEVLPAPTKKAIPWISVRFTKANPSDSFYVRQSTRLGFVEIKGVNDVTPRCISDEAFLRIIPPVFTPIPSAEKEDHLMACPDCNSSNAVSKAEAWDALNTLPPRLQSRFDSLKSIELVAKKIVTLSASPDDEDMLIPVRVVHFTELCNVLGIDADAALRKRRTGTTQ